MAGRRGAMWSLLLLSFIAAVANGALARFNGDAKDVGLGARSNGVSAQEQQHQHKKQQQQQQQQLLVPVTPNLFSRNKGTVNDRSRRSSAAFLLPRAGGARTTGLPGKGDGTDQGPFSRALERAVAVNAVSWAALVSGVVLWSRTKMGPEKGIVRKALVGVVISTTSVQVACNVLRAVLGNVDDPPGQDHGASALAGLKTFRWAFLGVLAVCNLGEFVQGAYIYQVYSENNGLDMGQISKMFLAGMISAMVTGLFAGSFLDRYGRRSGCMLWAFLNMLQCVLIHSKVFGALVLGRVIAGAGATLLATAFESWMVTEHHSRGYPPHLLADTFRMATWGIGLATVASGFLAEASVSAMGLLAPFNLAIGVSVVAILLIGGLWKENYGNRSFSAFHHTKEALDSIVSDSRLLMMGLVQVLFEGAMLSWIIVWVPALKSASPTKPVALGTVFSTMMLSMCGGSSLFKLLTEGLPVRLAFSPEACLAIATGVSTVALGASSMEPSSAKLLSMFLVYEACMGLYFPAMATCRSKYIEDRMRGTVMNITRVPMNLVAALMMLGPVGNSSVALEDRLVTVFGILASLTGVATLIQVLLLQREREASMAFAGTGAVASLPKIMEGREGTGSSAF